MRVLTIAENLKSEEVASGVVASPSCTLQRQHRHVEDLKQDLCHPSSFLRENETGKVARVSSLFLQVDRPEQRGGSTSGIARSYQHGDDETGFR